MYIISEQLGGSSLGKTVSSNLSIFPLSLSSSLSRSGPCTGLSYSMSVGVILMQVFLGSNIFAVSKASLLFLGTSLSRFHVSALALFVPPLPY